MKKVIGIGVVVVLVGASVFFMFKKQNKEIVPVPEVAKESVIPAVNQPKEIVATSTDTTITKDEVVKAETQAAPVVK